MHDEAMKAMYASFNDRDIDTVLGAMHPMWTGPMAWKVDGCMGTKAFVNIGRGNGA
jgi:hypothetical protein